MIHPIVALVADHAHDFSPWSPASGADTLAERFRRLSPMVARERLGNDDDRPLLEDFGPCYRAACDQSVAHRLEVSRREALESAQRARLRRRSALQLDRVAVVFAVHRDRRGETNGSDAWHSGKPFRDALVSARRLLWIADESWGYRKDKRLELLRPSEARFYLTHRDEGPHHQT